MFEETVHLFGYFQGKLNPYLPFISIYNGQHMMSLKFDNFIFSWTVVTEYTLINLLSIRTIMILSHVFFDALCNLT